MKILFAPMEGIAHWLYRSAQHACFDGADEYFLPFWSPRGQSLTHREQADALPENNAGMKAVPQILSNSSEDFLWAAEKLKKLGYAEVNSNLDEPAPIPAEDPELPAELPLEESMEPLEQDNDWRKAVEEALQASEEKG